MTLSKDKHTSENVLLDIYAASALKVMLLLDEGFDDVTAVLSLPLRYRKRLRTTNGIERLNQEIRRWKESFEYSQMKYQQSG